MAYKVERFSARPVVIRFFPGYYVAPKNHFHKVVTAAMEVKKGPEYAVNLAPQEEPRKG